jgi:methylmalonyl-CoA mutase C-terminal domain/subunit
MVPVEGRVMPLRKTRILLGRIGEGQKETQLNLAKRFGEAGFEVIYTDLQEPEAIVRSAIQESVDHIGMTTLPGYDLRVLSELLLVLKREDALGITVAAGGFLDPEDLPKVKEMGVAAFFPRGTPFEALIAWARAHITPADGHSD